MELSENQIERISEDLIGTCNTIESVMEILMIDEKHKEEVESRIEECDIELCNGCGWWVETYDLINDENEQENTCSNCRESK